MKTVLSKTVRIWLYGLCLAALPLLLFYGLVEPAAAPIWLAFVLALFNLKADDSPS